MLDLKRTRLPFAEYISGVRASSGSHAPCIEQANVTRAWEKRRKKSDTGARGNARMRGNAFPLNRWISCALSAATIADDVGNVESQP